MKVSCAATNLSRSTQLNLVSFDAPLINWDLSLGEIYTVYSISVCKNVLHYLVVPEECGLPDWYPAELFEVVNEKLPENTYFKNFTGDPRGLNALWGYQEMVLNYSHYGDLLERQEHALHIFHLRKQEFDNSAINSCK